MGVRSGEGVGVGDRERVERAEEEVWERNKESFIG